MTRTSRRTLFLAAAVASALLGGCAYNPFTDPYSYVGPGPSEPVRTPLFQTPGCGYPPGQCDQLCNYYPWVRYY